MKTDPETLVRRHIVDARGLYPAFRERPARRHDSSLQECRLNDKVPNRLTEQRRLSVYKWNPGLRRGNEAAIEKLIAVKWHFLTNRFNLIHYGGCAVLAVASRPHHGSHHHWCQL